MFSWFFIIYKNTGKNKQLSTEEKLQVFFRALRLIAQLHENGLSHNSISHDAFLIDKNLHVHLRDLSSVKKSETHCKEVKGQLHYSSFSALAAHCNEKYGYEVSMTFCTEANDNWYIPFLKHFSFYIYFSIFS